MSPNHDLRAMQDGALRAWDMEEVEKRTEIRHIAMGVRSPRVQELHALLNDLERHSGYTFNIANHKRYSRKEATSQELAAGSGNLAPATCQD